MHDLAREILNIDVPARQACAPIAEFADGSHALRFARLLGASYTVTAGINYVYAVRRLQNWPYVPERPLSPPEPENGWRDYDEEDDVDFDDGLEDDESE